CASSPHCSGIFCFAPYGFDSW
nr:immunoglobulin heavy chain junction region [Macaca mulatta]MOV54071.1 immunoglobulin heavy chain junction region [Macaca mulatta]MOV54328.1 immunoglobulin heavy chain junction region [Macaca mulatta]MOV55128.1 immunoglobulin heavy chain junction region [Macaca mulatta]MOV56051.1 immunoglobulin heavy chain junction region [Macaca mulatta]